MVAEILLRREAGAVDRALEYLRAKGIEASAVGAASISIRCEKALFESVFGTTLEEEPPPARAPKGVKDFGPVGGPRYRARGPIVVPPEIRDSVASVELEPPPRYLR